MRKRLDSFHERRVVAAGLIFLFLLIGTMQVRGDTVIDLRKGDDLKMLYDGGLRPWHLLGMEGSNLESGPENITVILSTGESFHLQVQSGSFTIVGDGKLADCGLFGKQTSVEMGVAQAKSICNSLQLSAAGLDQLVENLDAVPDARKFWTSQDVSHDPLTLQVTFQPLFGFQKVTASVRIFLSWKRSLSEMVAISPEPLKPPPGYEGVSMEPPPRDPNANPLPEHDLKYYQTLAGQAHAKGSMPGPPAPPAHFVEVKATPTPISTGTRLSRVETKRQGGIWPWGLGFLAAVIGIGFLVKRRT